MHAETLYGQTPNLLEDTLNFTDGELGVLDEATADFLTAWPGYKTELAAAGIVKNKRIAHASIPGIFFLKSLRPQIEGSSRAITTLSMVGILAEPWEEWQERRLREISAFGQVVSIGPVEKTIIAISETEKGKDPEEGEEEIEVRRRVPKLDDLGEVEYKIFATPSGTAERWNINDPGITVTDTYFVREEPITTVIGTKLTPPEPPTPPAYVWGGYAEPMRANHPNGWVLTDRKISIIIPGEIWKVVDNYDYFQNALPD